MRIDAHQHYWKISRGDYGWITPELPVLHRDFLPHDLLPELSKHRIDYTIAVQAAPTIAETEFLLQLADNDDRIIGVVGWLDPADPHCIEEYERLSAHPKYVGFRVMIQEMEDASDILKPDFVRTLQYFERYDVPVDILVKSNQLDSVVKLLEHVSNLRGVVDHVAKPRIAEGVIDPWKDQMSRIAAFPNIFCKISGMVTEADHTNWQQENFVPYIRHTLEQFGPERVLFGSDWPVCLLAGSYDDVVAIVEHALPETWSELERENLFGGNAKVFYKL